jgi:integrase
MCKQPDGSDFAGLRTAEVSRLAPEDIQLERGFIEVRAENAKTRRRRLVRIQPNLAAWLRATEPIPGNLFDRVESVWRAAGVAWPVNVARHSFVSYHLAAFESAAKTALEAGHSEQMLFAHYRELVTPEAAREYWAIFPA